MAVISLETHRAPAVLGPVTGPARDLPLGAAQVALSLLHQEELLIQGVLLQLQLLHEARSRLQLLLQGKDGAVLGFDLIHLRRKKEKKNIDIKL